MKWCKLSSGITERRHKTRVWIILLGYVWIIPLGYVVHLQVWGHQGPLLFSGVFIAEEVDEAGDNRSRHITMVHVWTLLEAVLSMSTRFSFY
jgi:hypothetical protein